MIIRKKNILCTEGRRPEVYIWKITDISYALSVIMYDDFIEISNEVYNFHDGKYKPDTTDIMSNNDLGTQKSAPHHALLYFTCIIHLLWYFSGTLVGSHCMLCYSTIEGELYSIIINA